MPFTGEFYKKVTPDLILIYLAKCIYLPILSYQTLVASIDSPASTFQDIQAQQSCDSTGSSLLELKLQLAINSQMAILTVYQMCELSDTLLLAFELAIGSSFVLMQAYQLTVRT